MGVEDAAREGVVDRLVEDRAEAGHGHQVDVGARQGVDHRAGVGDRGRSRGRSSSARPARPGRRPPRPARGPRRGGRPPPPRPAARRRGWPRGSSRSPTPAPRPAPGRTYPGPAALRAIENAEARRWRLAVGLASHCLQSYWTLCRRSRRQAVLLFPSIELTKCRCRRTSSTSTRTTPGRWVQPYGHQVPTPNIQHLADQGVLFRQAFSAAPVCSGSRAALLTGQYCHTNGMLGLAHRGWALHDYGKHLGPHRCGRPATTRR